MVFWELREMIQLARTRELREIKSTLIKTSIKHVASKVQLSLGISFLETNKTSQGSNFYNFFSHVSWIPLKDIPKTTRHLRPDFRLWLHISDEVVRCISGLSMELSLRKLPSKRCVSLTHHGQVKLRRFSFPRDSSFP